MSLVTRGALLKYAGQARLNTLYLVAAFAAAFLGGALSYFLILPNGNIVVAWLPAGLLLGGLLSQPRTRWLALLAGGFLGTLVLEFTKTGRIGFALVAAAANIFETGVAGAVCARLVALPLTLTTIREVVSLVVGAGIVSNAATALTGALAISAHSPWPVWVAWWLGDGIGMIVAAPLVVAWTSGRRRLLTYAKGTVFEAVAASIALGLATSLIFGSHPPMSTNLVTVPYLILPLLIWVAFRFGPIGAVTASAQFSIHMLWLASLGHGPFNTAVSGLIQRGVDPALFLALCTVSALVMSVLLVEREAAETELGRAEAMNRVLVEHAPEAVVVFDVGQRRFAQVNPEATRMFGLSRTALLQNSILELTPERQPDGRLSREAGAEYLDRALQGEVPTFDWLLCHSSGATFLTEVRLVRLPAERPLVRGSIIDVTKHRVLEAELRQAQKIDIVGRLAGGIAHDFGNLLTVVQSYSEVLLSQLPVDSAAAKHAGAIRAAAERGSGLTRQLMSISRRRVVRDEVIDLNAAIVSAREMLARLIGEHIELVTDLVSEPPFVRIDGSQMEQVLLNLLVNARDALPNGGHIVIRTRRLLLGSGEHAAGDALAPGKYVQLRVEDDGHGMDAATAQHIFEPFFTTKPDDRGTGLGLSTVRDVVVGAGGTITVTSEPNCGAVFDVYLPVVGPETAVPTVEPIALPSGGTETLLLAEDEITLREILQQFLEGLGYTVLTAGNGVEALRIADNHQGIIHLVVTDVVMPEMGGPMLVSRLLPLRPDLRVLFLSGHVGNEFEGQAVSAAAHAFLEKPFSLALLARTVRETLESPAAN